MSTYSAQGLAGLFVFFRESMKIEEFLVSRLLNLLHITASTNQRDQISHLTEAANDTYSPPPWYLLALTRIQSQASQTSHK